MTGRLTTVTCEKSMQQMIITRPDVAQEHAVVATDCLTLVHRVVHGCRSISTLQYAHASGQRAPGKGDCTNFWPPHGRGHTCSGCPNSEWDTGACMCSCSGGARWQRVHGGATATTSPS